MRGGVLGGIGANPDLRPPHLTFLPAMTMPSLPRPEFAVASTLGASFLGFLASLLPLLLSLDIERFLFRGATSADAEGIAAVRVSGLRAGAGGIRGGAAEAVRRAEPVG